MSFGDGYDYEKVDREYMTWKDDGGEQGYNIGYKEGYQDGIRAAGGTKADTKTALTGWVRTADRLPEAGQLFLPIVKDGDEWAHGSIRKAKEDVADKALDYWIPIPPLPETAGVEGTKINGGE